MKKSELKDLIRELYIQEISLKEEIDETMVSLEEKEEEEEETEEETESEEIDMDMDMNMDEGDNSVVLDALTKALEQAKQIGDEKLVDQIGNTITFFTRTHIVGKETPINEVKRFKTLAGIIK